MDERSQRETDARRRLDAEDLPADLLALAARYAAHPILRPTPDDTARLLTHLLTMEPGAVPAAPLRYRYVPAALRLVRWRLRLLGPWFWVVSVLLVILGMALTPAMSRVGAALPFIALIPLTTVLGLAYALRTPSAGLRAVEASAPVGFVEVTAGLTLAILALDGVFGVTASAIIALAHWAPFAPLLAAWLGPLLLLTGVSLPVALRWGTGPALAVGAGPWLALTLAAVLQPTGPGALVFALPRDALSASVHVAVAALGGGLVLLTLIHGGTGRTPAAL